MHLFSSLIIPRHVRVHFAASVLFLLVSVRGQSQAAATTKDPFRWLEDTNGAPAMAWVKAENVKSDAVLEADSHYKPFLAQALRSLENPLRLPVPTRVESGMVYNVWRDSDHPRGIFRRTPLSAYGSASPDWQTLIDFDALGKAEHVGWISWGRYCLYPNNSLCMVGLSNGGEDAITEREFDLRTGSFVPSGFTLSRSKQAVAWLDQDTLLVGRDWGPGTLTASGYPFIVKQWKRGTPLSTAREVFRGKATDETAGCVVQHDAEGDRAVLCQRGITIFASQFFLQTASGMEHLALPEKADVVGLLGGSLLVQLRQHWTPAATRQPLVAGSLVELSLADALHDPAHLKPSVIFAPTRKEFMQEAAPTGSSLLLTTLDNVQGKAYLYTRGSGGWKRKPLPVPSNTTVSIAAVSDTDDAFCLEVTGFLTPPAIYAGHSRAGTLTLAKSEPAGFDATREAVDQYEATSKDGTHVPYFVVHRKDWKRDGNNATLLNAYGGFGLAETPNYSVTRGRLWLEHGNVFVLANIRGGGEFGPDWHQAAVKTHRQRSYDDFAAVAEDLVARKITSPRHLGIMGESNGGLLMGVEMEQHPDLWHAVVIQIPLLDMLRYEHIAAGSSWVGEYGSVSNPAERRFLTGISPYNQLRRGVHYPTPLILTSTKDDRVGPQHARKFAAKMEELHEPFFYNEFTEGGHSDGASLQEQARTAAYVYTYLELELQ